MSIEPLATFPSSMARIQYILTAMASAIAYASVSAPTLSFFSFYMVYQNAYQQMNLERESNSNKLRKLIHMLTSIQY